MRNKELKDALRTLMAGCVSAT